MSDYELYLSIVFDRLLRPSLPLVISVVIWVCYHTIGFADAVFVRRVSSKSSILLILMLGASGLFMLVAQLSTLFMLMNSLTITFLLSMSMLSFKVKKKHDLNIVEGDFYIIRAIYHLIVSTVCCFLIAVDKV